MYFKDFYLTELETIGDFSKVSSAVGAVAKTAGEIASAPITAAIKAINDKIEKIRLKNKSLDDQIVMIKERAKREKDFKRKSQFNIQVNNIQNQKKQNAQQVKMLEKQKVDQEKRNQRAIDLRKKTIGKKQEHIKTKGLTYRGHGIYKDKQGKSFKWDVRSKKMIELDSITKDKSDIEKEKLQKPQPKRPEMPDVPFKDMKDSDLNVLVTWYRQMIQWLNERKTVGGKTDENVTKRIELFRKDITSLQNHIRMRRQKATQPSPSQPINLTQAGQKKPNIPTKPIVKKPLTKGI